MNNTLLNLCLLAFIVSYSCLSNNKPTTISQENKSFTGKWQLLSIGNIMPAFGYVFEIENDQKGKIEDEGQDIPFKYKINNNKISFASADKRSTNFPFIDGEWYFYKFSDNGKSTNLQLLDKEQKVIAQYNKL